MPYEFVDNPPASGRYQFVDEPKGINAATDFGGNNLQVYNPAQLWNPKATNFDTGIPLSQGVNNFLAGAGKAYADTGRGVRQLYGLGADAIAPRQRTLSDLVTGSDPSRSAAIQPEIDEAKRHDADLMGTGAGLGGNIAGNLLISTAPAGALSKIAGGAGLARTAAALKGFANPTSLRAAVGSGALQGALGPVASDESRLGNTELGALSGAAGNVIPAVAGRIAQPIKSSLSAGGQAALAALDKAGVPLDLAQRTGSQLLGKVKSFLHDNPFTTGKQGVFEHNQREAFNDAALQSAGASPGWTRAEPDALNEARTNTQAIMDQVADQTPIPYSTIERHLTALESNPDLEPLSDAAKARMRSFKDDVLTQAASNNGVLTGDAYRRINTRMGATLAHAGGPDSADIKAGVGAVKGAMDSALQETASPELRDSLLRARGQYRNLKQIEGAVSLDADRNIIPSKLVSQQNVKAQRSARLYGSNTDENQGLINLAEAGKTIGDPNPNSGTFGRHLMGAGLMGAGVGGLEALEGLREGQMPNPSTLGGIALGGVLAPKYFLQPMLNSQRIGRYLSRGITPGATRSALESPQRSMLINALLRRGLPQLVANAPKQEALQAPLGQ